ncbi:hypothetical protein [Pontibacter sp. G13]|uniref:hypothetical protein n=1 Tax=Pontibacter sp. G13 TaxID=3074898 RepID=UPI002889B7EA|nr:hypothetical protein [Pontibacter sp. G13]WNJ21442.1 hypothetical protein RJD25_13315 [Pontibacter sp. G13]
MKTIPSLFITAILLVCATFSGKAQDLIVQLDDTEIIASIVSMDHRKIEYHEYGDTLGNPSKISLNDVYMVIFEDGMEQYFHLDPTQTIQYVNPLPSGGSWPSSNPQYSNSQTRVSMTPNLETDQFTYMDGQQDAATYYTGKKAFWATFGTSVIPGYGFITGAVTGGIVAAVPPQPAAGQVGNLNAYHYNLEYQAGYNREAKRIKSRKALKGYGVGILTQTLLFLLLVAAAN